MNTGLRSALALIALLLSACAEIAPPTPGEILESPFGKGPLRIGMSKDEVRDVWGEPDTVTAKEPDKWGSVRETWIYEGRLPGAPINAGYTSKTKVLEFDGASLVSFHD